MMSLENKKQILKVLNRDKTTWSYDELLTEKQRKVKELHDSGLKPKEIIEKSKMSTATVYRALKILKMEANEKSN